MLMALGISMNFEKGHCATTWMNSLRCTDYLLWVRSPPFHTRVRVYLTGSDPLSVDLMSIRSDLAARYVNQDCSFDLHILMVRDGGVFDAFLFPWSLFAVPSADWRRTINAQQYRIAIPDD